MQLKNKVQSLFVFGGVFIVLYIFFTRIHPLIIYDTDDWTYISSTRDAFPLMESWNPGRILPEILMPLCASVATWVLYPITGDYIMAMAYIFAFVLCLTIVIYIYMFKLMLDKKMNCDKHISIFVAIISLLLHFMIFRKFPHDNVYAFYAIDVTCYFYYIIPSLLNIILIFTLELYPELFRLDTKHILRTGFMFLVIYLAIFSNLFSSYIIAIWAGIKMIIPFQLKKHTKEVAFLRHFFKKYLLNIVIICLWIVSMIYELNGGRAHSLNQTADTFPLKKTIIFATDFLKKINLLFVLLFIVLLIVQWVILHTKYFNFKELSDFAKEIFIFELLSIVYLIMLCAKTKAEYITRTEIIFGPVAVLIFAFCTMLVILINSLPKIAVALPLLCCIIFFDINITEQTFLESNTKGVDWKIAYQIDNYIIQQIKQAEDEGKIEVQLHVPFYASGDNWPQALPAASRFSQSLYKHGIISREMKVIMIPDKNINLRYCIPE